MKTARWSTCRVAGQVDRSECAVTNCCGQWTREDNHTRKTGSGVTRKTTRREDRRIVRQALLDPTVTRSTIRVGVDVAIVPQTISRHLAEANLKSKRHFRALPLTPEHRQKGKMLCLLRNPGLFWGQMITVYGCGDALVSGAIPSTLFYVTLPAQLV
ncbi:HTH_Tnp_Tc3_2 domain-containing protein [Trichonephila clavipes]|nr:HTH_Tnp_Tc3_2 domain-containing protein [Trichonephila clavipes]